MKKALVRFFWLAMAAFAFRACVLEPVKVSDESMSPTLVDGDVALVWKLRYGLRVPGAGAMLVEWSQPKKDDVVVVVAVGDPPMSLVRRISALPGDTVALPGGQTTVLKAGEYYIRAAQEEGAVDSRRLGPISRKAIIGKVTHTWFGKNPSSTNGSKVESEKSGILQPIL